MSNLIRVRNTLNLVRDFLFMFLVVCVVMQFIVCKSKVPSPSMEPTIMTNDRIVYSRISSYYREPERGEVVIFKEGNQQLIKRLIGLPGEEIDLIDGKVYIDGVELIEKAYLGEEVVTEALHDPRYESIRFPYTVPEGSYFFMGDNRPGSLDSRIFGAISKEVITAIGAYRIYPFDKIGEIK